MNSKSCSSKAPRRLANKLLFCVCFIAAGLGGASLARAGGDAPGWMHALAGTSLPSYDPQTSAVLLYSENVLTVQPNGKIKRIERRAYKILRPDGRHLAKQHFVYYAGT